MTSKDYSAQKYSQLCLALKESGYHSLTVFNFISQKKIGLNDKVVVLRHDVDRAAITSIALAEVEQRLGFQATYYFRIPGTWQKDVVSQIKSMGHEVGLHYESVDKAKGDLIKAVEILKADLTKFRETSPVQTAAMHGNPATPFNNLDVWKHIQPTDLGLAGEAYLSLDFEKVLYYSDTGRNWTDGKDSIYDQIPVEKKRIAAKKQAQDTDSLIRIIEHEDRNLYLLTHPERWPSTQLGWMLSTAKDWIANPLKRIIRAGYNLGP